MKKREIVLVVILLAAALFMLWLGKAGPHTEKDMELSVDAEYEISKKTELDDDMDPTVTQELERAKNSAELYLREHSADSYLLIRTKKRIYSPIPLNEENALRITQEDGAENVIHIMENAFYMESSNCENQNCVEEGEVTLENREDRALLNMVLCLPHELTLELLTPQEAGEVLTSVYVRQETYMGMLDESSESEGNAE